MVEDLIKRLRDMMYRVSRDDAEKLGEIIAALDASTLAMSKANVALEAANARITALESERDALLAAAGKEAVIPDGWKLVPIKPTVEIVKAGGKARVDDFNRNGTTLSPKDANRVAEAMYRAMIEAAPTAALENGDGRDAWISVDERLPEEGQDVAFIVHAAAGSIQEHLNDRVLGGKFLTVGRYPTFTVPGLAFNASHWQHLPGAPADAIRALSQKESGDKS